jgi:hypothetical protein
LVCILLGFNLFWSVIMWNMVVCILSYSFWLFSISILCTGNLISMCVITRESTIVLQLSPGSPLLYYSYHQGVHYCITVINMSFGFYSCYIFVNSVSPYSISNSSSFIVCKSDSTSVRGLWVLSIFYFINFWWCVIFKLKSLSEIALVLVHSRTRCF